jgi:hypothetical protein
LLALIGCVSAPDAKPSLDFVDRLNCWAHMLPLAERVTVRRFAGTVVGSNDLSAPLKGVQVYVTPLGEVAASAVRQATSDDAGHFMILGLPDGQYDAVACHPGGGFNPWIGVVTISKHATKDSFKCSMELGT